MQQYIVLGKEFLHFIVL